MQAIAELFCAYVGLAAFRDRRFLPVMMDLLRGAIYRKLDVYTAESVIRKAVSLHALPKDNLNDHDGASPSEDLRLVSLRADGGALEMSQTDSQR